MGSFCGQNGGTQVWRKQEEKEEDRDKGRDHEEENGKKREE